MTDVKWTTKDIPPQDGHVFVVTGANSGLGYETSRALAGAGATVVMACRNLSKGEEAMKRIQDETGSSKIELRHLDLGDLSSVHHFAESLLDTHDRLHVLVNNAGVMYYPPSKTADGFEIHMGVNHLGHFALTGLLLPLLMKSDGSRVVVTSSIMHKFARLDPADIFCSGGASKNRLYANSKLANLLFTYELQRRLEAAGSSTISVAAHPGYSRTNLQYAGAESAGSRLRKIPALLGNALFAQPAWKGALPQLYAATAPEVSGGQYFGPSGPFEAWGHPKQVKSSRASHDPELMRELWRRSEELTSVEFTV